MLKLLKKELTLNNLPVLFVFPVLCVLLCVPYYPASISISYGLLGMFLMLNYGQTNRDMDYVGTLPITRKDIIKGKLAFAVFVEGMQLLSGAVFALIGLFAVYPDMFTPMAAPNFTLFGILLILFAAFNVIFFARYFSSGGKTGVAAILAFVVYVIGLALTEVMSRLFYKSPLFSTGAEGIGWRLLVFAIGLIIYAAGLVGTYFICVKKFEKVNL